MVTSGLEVQPGVGRSNSGLSLENFLFEQVPAEPVTSNLSELPPALPGPSLVPGISSAPSLAPEISPSPFIPSENSPMQPTTSETEPTTSELPYTPSKRPPVLATSAIQPLQLVDHLPSEPTGLRRSTHARKPSARVRERDAQLAEPAPP